MGRPSDYSAEVTETICGLLAHGKSLVTICKLQDMPSYTTVMEWLGKHPEFAERYARAREEQAEFYAQEIIDIADELPECEMPAADGGKDKRVDSAGIQRNRLRVDARKWVASKLLPKKYGDFERKEVSGPDGAAIPLSLEINL